MRRGRLPGGWIHDGAVEEEGAGVVLADGNDERPGRDEGEERGRHDPDSHRCCRTRLRSFLVDLEDGLVVHQEILAVPEEVGEGRLHVRGEPFEQIDESTTGVP